MWCTEYVPSERSGAWDAMYWMQSNVFNRNELWTWIVNGNGMYQKLIVFIQTLAAVAILVFAVITWTRQPTSELRIEMREEFRSFRTEMQEKFLSFRIAMREEHAAIREEMHEEHAEMRDEIREEHAAIRAEIHAMNKRLGRVEGEVRTLTQERE